MALYIIFSSPRKLVFYNFIRLLLLFSREGAHTTVSHLPWTLANRMYFLMVKISSNCWTPQQLSALGTEPVGWETERIMSVHARGHCLSERHNFPQAITWTTNSFPKAPLPFFSHLLNHCFFNRKPNKSLFTLNIGLFMFRVFIVAKQLIDFF